MKIHTGICKTCQDFLKPEETARGTCEPCEKAINEFVKKAGKKLVSGGTIEYLGFRRR